MPETGAEDAPEIEVVGLRENSDEAKAEAGGGQTQMQRQLQLQRQRQKLQDDKFGMLALAGEAQEYDPDGGESCPFDVVAVHGLYGDLQETWTIDGVDGAPGRRWLKDHMFERYPNSRIFTFSYDAGNARAGISTVSGIKEKALQLLNELLELRGTSQPGIIRPLVFIAHDVGGIIVKEALSIATSEYRKYWTIRHGARLLIFFGCPHRCISNRDMEDKVAILSFARGKPPPFAATSTIKELSRSIIEINGSFALSNTMSLINIVNVYSEDKDVSLRVFDTYMTTLDVPFEERIGYSKPHEEICKFVKPDELYAHINRALGGYLLYIDANESLLKHLQICRLLAAPTYPLESRYGLENGLHWISKHEMYTKWLDGYGPGIIHVHGTTGASEASEYIFQNLDVYRTVKQKNEILIYFTFNQYNNRCNSIVAMLSTFLAQIISQDQTLITKQLELFEETSFHRSWTQTDLMLNFRTLLSNPAHGGILCVINGLDECDDSRTAFVQDICEFANQAERRWKIAITSTADSGLKAALDDWPTIDLDDQFEGRDTANGNVAIDTDMDVMQLLQQRPEFCEFERTITEKLSTCGRDKQWRTLVLAELRLSKGLSTRAATQRELDLLPPLTPKDIFVRTLARVSSQRWVWARKALSWILYTLEPISIWELGVALALGIDSQSDGIMDLDNIISRHVIANLEEVFGGMFVIKHNEVHFGHPDVRKFLLAANGEQEHVWYDVNKTAHDEITAACHFYLSLQQVQDYIVTSYGTTPTNPIEAVPFIPRNSLLVYAIRYWPRHHALIPERLRPTERVLKFLRDTKAFRSWAEAYWWFSNPISRTNRAFFSTLPILAGLGLQDLVTTWLNLDADTPTASEDRALALTEAARNSHVDVVRKLLSYRMLPQPGGYEQPDLQDALVAGASCCNHDVLDELVTYVAESFENFEWPPALLCRAAQLGQSIVVQKLLKCGASLDLAVTVHNMTPLHLAAREGKLEIIQVLLEHKASITTLSDGSSTPLHVASRYGHETAVKLILSAGADANLLDGSDVNALYLACLQGKYKAVKVLAEAGCHMGCVKDDSWSPLTLAVDDGFINSARFLLEKKADVEIEGPGNWTPLRYAAFRGNLELCRLLLENGANVNTIRGSDGDPIVFHAAISGNLEVVKLLVENSAAVDAVNSAGQSLLHNACLYERISIVSYLLDCGSNVKQTTGESGSIPLHTAIGQGFAEIAQLLVDKGADLFRADEDGWTALHLAFSNAEITRILLESGADVNCVANACTPLILAATNNHVEVVKVLLSYSPDLEVEYGDQRYTALFGATTDGHIGPVRLLLEAGANVNHQTKSHYFPLQFAVSSNNEDLIRTLMEFNPDLDLVDDNGDIALQWINSSTTVAIVRFLINGGLDLESRNNRRETPICTAVTFENLDILKCLIAKKAKLNIIGGKYGSPLNIACRWSKLEVVKTLIAAGADVNLVDPSVGTPIQSACMCFEPGDKTAQETVISYLINEANADVTIVGGSLASSLNAACGWSTPKMIKLILEKSPRIDVEDRMGRVAVHFAAAQSLDNFQIILAAGGDVESRDKMGRTALHWAISSGLLDIIERVLALSRGLVDPVDIDGWTPLLWAARGRRWPDRPATSISQEKIIKFLLDRGADPCVTGKGLDRKWSPVKVARYHGVKDTIVQLLIAKAKSKLMDKGQADTWDEDFHMSEKATEVDASCDSCLFSVCGIRYKCETCLDFDLCFKCYLSGALLHPDHTFKEIGPEYEPAVETAPNEEGDRHDMNDDDDTDDDDTDDDSTGDDDRDDNGPKLADHEMVEGREGEEKPEKGEKVWDKEVAKPTEDGNDDNEDDDDDDDDDE